MFNLPRQIISDEIVKIVARQYKNKDLGLEPLTRKNLKEIVAVLKQIEKHTIPDYLLCKKLKGKLGHGIFLHPSAKPILRGQVIAPYAGFVSIVSKNGDDHGDYSFDPVTDLKLTKEEQAHFDPKRRYHPNRLYALKLDALEQGNFTRFINHSAKPNVVAFLVSTKANPYEIMYFAKKTIYPGEQLLVCYEDGDKSYWGAIGVTPYPMTPKTFQVDDALQLFESKPSADRTRRKTHKKSRRK
jgi:hypothetical protein